MKISYSSYYKMFKLVYLFTFICFSSSVELQNSRPVHPEHYDASLEIIGGKVVTPHSLPEVVFLAIELYNATSQKYYFAYCGATLLSHNYLLTAAHCVDDNRGIFAMIGVHNVTVIEAGAQYIVAKNAVMHNNFNPKTLENDIAIIELSQSANYNNQSQPVRLPTWSDVNKTYVGESVTVAGWGKTKDGGPISDTLRSVNYSIIDLADCKRQALKLRAFIPDEDICAATVDAAGKIRNSCGGDSGGPMFHGKNRTQIGIVSFGATVSCESGAPDVLVKVTNYLGWIEQNSDVKIAK